MVFLVHLSLLFVTTFSLFMNWLICIDSLLAKHIFFFTLTPLHDCTNAQNIQNLKLPPFCEDLSARLSPLIFENLNKFYRNSNASGRSGKEYVGG